MKKNNENAKPTETQMMPVPAIMTKEGAKEHAEKLYNVAQELGKLTGALGENGNWLYGLYAQAISEALALVCTVAEALDPDGENHEDGSYTDEGILKYGKEVGEIGRDLSAQGLIIKRTMHYTEKES